MYTFNTLKSVSSRTNYHRESFVNGEQSMIRLLKYVYWLNYEWFDYTTHDRDKSKIFVPLLSGSFQFIKPVPVHRPGPTQDVLALKRKGEI